MRSFVAFLTESPSTVDLDRMYAEFNRDLFGGVLPRVPISWGNARKGAAGVTTYKIVRPGGSRTNIALMQARVLPDTIEVIIQRSAWSDFDKLQGVVAHEMCHVACAAHNQIERDSHGHYFQTWRQKAQQRAGFEIPLADSSDIDDLENPKPVMFIVGQKPDNRYGVFLFRPTLAQDPSAVEAARASVEVLVQRQRYKWAASGVAKTNLANVMKIARTMTTASGYILDDPKKLRIQQIFHTDGPFPHELFS